MRLRGQVAEVYLDFAGYAAADSPCFADWARGVVGDHEVQDWLASLPEPKRQPNLVFAAARRHGVPAPAPYSLLRNALLADDGAIRATILARATQTNEVGRLATLVPAFAQVAEGRPLALLEVGASAGLCLYPDRWGYRWRTPTGLRTAGPPLPSLSCDVSGRAPLPEGAEPPVRVAWRGGIDLNPLDVTDPDHTDWLLTLVWPEHDDRRARLGTAIAIARTDPPDLRRGDLLDLLPGLVAEAAAAVEADGGRVVVFHSAVIAYLDDRDRQRFADVMTALVVEGRCHWVSNEGPLVLPDLRVQGRVVPDGRFVLGVDGRVVGHTHGHGRSLHWW